MKINNIKYLMAAAVVGVGLTSCEDFLDRPAEDTYNAGIYYKTDEQCISAVNYLSNSPWSDFSRCFLWIGDMMSGNLFVGGGDHAPYRQLNITSNAPDYLAMSEALWSVNGHSNVVYNYVKGGSASQAAKNQAMGEALVWKAMSNFFLVRIFGDMPIIHDNVGLIDAGSYNDQYKVEKADVYEYIVMTLEKAIELLPEKASQNRLDKYCAKGLLAKVYLTKAGVSGSLNKDDLQKAVELAKDVKNNSGRELEKNYADCFTLEGNNSPENMIAWRWTVGAHWTCQNMYQSDLAPSGFDSFQTWGQGRGVTRDLMNAFGLEVTDNPLTRIDSDTRRKATYMTAGDVIPYFYREKGGFDLLKFYYEKDYAEGATPGKCETPCGGSVVKHLHGTTADHVAGVGFSDDRMKSALCTPILRLADVYLVLAEAQALLDGNTTTNADALDAFNKVHKRAVPAAVNCTTLTFNDVWKERRVELALEGDRWYDFVRRSYYEPEACIAELKAQKRNDYWGIDDLFKQYYGSGVWSYDDSTLGYNADGNLNVSKSSFSLPFPTEDVTYNQHLMEDPIHVDVRKTFSY